MKITDPEVPLKWWAIHAVYDSDAAYLCVRGDYATMPDGNLHQVQVTQDLIVDVLPDGRVWGIEFLNAKVQLGERVVESRIALNAQGRPA